MPHANQGYLLGVDGGNTKTIALVAKPDGTIVGIARSGNSDIYAGRGIVPALDELDQAVAMALQQAGIAPERILASAISIAGADWPEDFVLLEAAVRQRGYGQHVQIYNDAIGALRAGTPAGIGVVVACGTATAIGARNRDGQIWHSSFWQEPGGGEHLGDQALRAVMRTDLGIDPPTALTATILDRTGLASIEAVLHHMTGRETRPEERFSSSSFGRWLLDVAEAGDQTAVRLVRAHGAALGDYALVAARKTGLVNQEFILALTGGVFRHQDTTLQEALVQRVQQQAPGAQPVRNDMEPVAGALLLAFDQAGLATGPELVARIRAGMPDHAFFAT